MLEAGGQVELARAEHYFFFRARLSALASRASCAARPDAVPAAPTVGSFLERALGGGDGGEGVE